MFVSWDPQAQPSGWFPSGVNGQKHEFSREAEREDESGVWSSSWR